MNNDRIRERLQKILALARQGVGGEKENAQRMLEKLLAKHNMTIADLDDTAEEKTTVEFKVKNDAEKKLLIQCAYKAIPGYSGDYFTYVRRGRKVSGLLGINMTRAQQVEIELMFNIYSKALKKHLEKQADVALSAFIQKNQIFAARSDEDGKGSELSDADLMALMAMMRGMESTPVLKQIGRAA